MKRLTIVIPCYNNGPNIAALEARLVALQALLSAYELEAVLVDDGSADDTYAQLESLCRRVPFRTVLVKLNANYGSYNAFLAGLHHGSGDVYAQVHADLQDPPEHLAEMLPHWEKGIPFVIGQRVRRADKESNLFFANLYHRAMKRFALPHIPEGGYDLILFDKVLRDHIVQLNERHTNLVYLISWLNYPYVTVPITREARQAGRSQWTFRKKYKLFIDSFVSFSYAPIQLITFSFLVAAVAAIPVLVFQLCFSPKALAVRLTFVFFTVLGLLLLMGMSILGEYLWRTLEHVRNRPPFIVEKVNSSAAPVKGPGFEDNSLAEVFEDIPE